MGMIEDGHVYSFSQLEQFDECKFSYYLQRIEDHKEDLVNNNFALRGSLIHDLLDKWAKREIAAEDLPAEYKKRYVKEVNMTWPRMLAAKGFAEKAYNSGLEYFENFNEFEGYKVLSSEMKFYTEIAGRKFVGLIDMILEDKETGALIILDHKSKSLSSFKKDEDNMYRQQTLYAKGVYEKYGRYPDILMFNLFGENGMLMQRKFDMESYEDVLHWAERQIEAIEEAEMIDWFDTKMQHIRDKAEEEGKDPDKVRLDFFCENICSCRNICPETLHR